MAKSLNMQIDFASLKERIGSQFRGLNQNDPGTWPPLPRATAYAVTLIVALAVGWYAWLSGVKDQLNQAQQQEVQLRDEYKSKLAQAVSLDLLKAQKAQVQQYVLLLEKQLPSKAEMDALLSDINQAGIGRGLQFELFRPGQVEVKNYYAELPITIKVKGSYNDLAAFTADVAKLSRIVTINNIAISSPPAGNPSGKLTMDATAKTFRYLDADEVAAQQKAKRPGGKK
ncbi:MAG: type 4a pilus biogenesis protein PilO [Betaproteobacteria bacterium]|jgi:type IV pilus assembly protein PilO|uniref:Pilus assembly protein, PilO n=1 Tax=Thiomonas delicata TaxID=364030 RepID=A0A238D269_THIDL|nr:MULTISPECIES: type 4a pilus biogenesis protein PilO [Thiomonas]MDE2129793.1 type 4a pilus biogenesis protein PilO [Betaproteobacteria bacterium]OZB45139.1 MAG: pilus assembly protein PilO [Thiomonas sp. 15-66-11]OZB62527.1 MAG: pilus assembly protein PilO [Thiomonas sp. 13-66-29]SBP87378.1 Pilus assembly protein, PilO [Thiomonas delicata]